MTMQRAIRASDQDRESVAAVLREAYAAGCLDKSELEERSGVAYSAKMLSDLQDLTSDLPTWPLKRPMSLLDQYYYGYRPGPAGRRTLGWSAGLLLAVTGSLLIVTAAEWTALAVILLVLLWLLALRP